MVSLSKLLIVYILSFADTMSVPGILGLIDCFIVKILKPHQNEKAYVHHDYKHSLNVQAVSIT